MKLSGHSNGCYFTVPLLAAFLLLTGLVSCAPTGIYHTVQPGQTLYRIATTYEIPEAELAGVNRISDPTRLKVGQKLFVPGVTQPRQVAAYTPAKPAAVKPRAASRPVQKETLKSAPPPAQPTPKKTASAKPAKPSAAPQKGVFIWPVKGKVVSKFGAKGGSANKGIEIACATGKPVVAAAPGKVIYSGNGIRGYGNLIIIEHADDFFTVYGYNKQNLVKTNDFVGQGDKIALSGQPRKGQSSRVHFEIRRGKSAVNPLSYLP
jgi:lipoprotein NlpD